MRIATWNVNSLRARLPRVLEWIDDARPDVLCLQETKLADDQVPAVDFEERGYTIAHHGEGRWNGVAIASRVGVDEVESGFGDALVDPYEGDARLVAATCGGLRVVDVYVPNGREVGSDTYERKLVWLDRLHEWLDARHSPDEALVVAGDWNVAPDDRDVSSPEAMAGATHVTAAERDRLGRLREWGLTDLFRERFEEDGLHTWWDYRGGSFHKRRGLRIDLLYGTAPVVERLGWVLTDRNARKGTKPSDHAPVVAELVGDLAGEA